MIRSVAENWPALGNPLEMTMDVFLDHVHWGLKLKGAHDKGDLQAFLVSRGDYLQRNGL